jgi:hypothetical protein
MTKRGRISGAEMGVIVGLPSHVPPPPPPDLPPSQAATWKATMAAVPTGYICPAAYPVVVELARHCDRASMLEGLIASFQLEWCREEGGAERLTMLLRAAQAESAAILSCCRSLRVTPQAVHPTTSARRLANHIPAGRQRPWGDPRSA